MLPDWWSFKVFEIAPVLSGLGDLWSTRIATISGRDITVNSLVLSLAIIVAGLTLSRVAARVVGTRLRARMPDPTVADAIQKAVFWVLLVVVLLTALQTINIPIHTFAFLGGAVAIGVGFGAQNIINNFISGWILMTERPVRLGDLIEVGGQPGRVESIGHRCTRIRRTDGVDMLVPNASLLENSVINWTLIDDFLRICVRVGVAYGSPTETVRDLLQQAAQEHEAVLKHPEPVLIFEDFGDNALIFDLYCWTRSRTPMEARKIGSALRFRIDALCHEHGVVIAFPQRDVHLDTSKPLDVRVQGSSD